MTCKKCLLFLALFCASFCLQAQQRLTGHVKDANGEPLAGVSVAVNGKVCAITDVDGNYQLSDVPSGATVTMSYLGFASLSKVADSGSLDFVLQEDSKYLDEAVVGAMAR